MNKIIFTIFFILSVNVYAQNSIKVTNAIGIMPNYTFFLQQQSVNENLKYDISNKGISVFFQYNLFINKRNYVSGVLMPNLTILNNGIELKAKDYNLPFDYVDYYNDYLPSISLNFSYSHIFASTTKFDFFLAGGLGAVSCLGINNSVNRGILGNDSLVTIKKYYNIKPSLLINFELGFRKKIWNDKHLNLSLFSQISLKEKYKAEDIFFSTIHKYSSTSVVSTNFSFIGLKFSYEY